MDCMGTEVHHTEKALSCTSMHLGTGGRVGLDGAAAAGEQRKHGGADGGYQQQAAADPRCACPHGATVHEIVARLELVGGGFERTLVRPLSRPAVVFGMIGALQGPIPLYIF